MAAASWALTRSTRCDASESAARCRHDATASYPTRCAARRSRYREGARVNAISSTTTRMPNTEVKLLPAERPRRLTDKMVKASDKKVPRVAVAMARTSADRGGRESVSQCRSVLTSSPR